MSQKEKRPNWYHPIARAEYDGAMRTYGEIQARVLPKDIAEQWDVDIPQTWREQPALYLLRGLGLGKKGLPPGTGFGLVQSPYSDIYTKIYGVNPINDLSKYRKMYRSHPDIQQAIQMQVNLAVGKGFTIAHDDEDVIQYLTKACNRLNLPQHMLTMGTDMLTYGNSFTEIQWDKSVSKKEQIYDYQGTEYTSKDLNKLNIPMKNVKPAFFDDGTTKANFIAQSLEKDPEAKKIVALKDLDPLYMRVRRDSYGNCLTPDSMVITNPHPKQISELTLQDKVLSKSGFYKNIDKLFKIPYKGNLIKISIAKNFAFDIKMTPEHPLLVAKKEKLGIKMEWASAENITTNDYLMYPIQKEEHDLEEKEIPIWSYHSGEHKFKLKITPELLRFFGLFIAEGYCTASQIMFAFHKKEIEYHEFVKNVFKNVFNLEAKEHVSKTTKCLVVYANSYAVSKLFKTLFGTGAKNKSIPDWIMYLPVEKQKHLFLGYLDGDGTGHKSSTDTQISATTVSQVLVLQLRDIALKCGYLPSIYKSEYFGKYGNKSFLYTIAFAKNPNRYCNSFKDENFVYLKVLKIEKEPYDGYVYDLRLEDKEDHSFAVNYCISHNCYGYIQWMAFPPVLIDNESCIHIKYRPMSWGYESAYGTSILMPIIKNTDLLNQFENDASVWIHSRAVPPLIVKGGTEEKPYSSLQMEALMSALKTRTAATMIFTKGDVNFEELKTMASDLNLDWWLKYLLLRRYQSLGVPPIFMGLTERGSKGTAEVLLHDFVTRLQVLQEFISDPIEEYIFRPLIKARFGEDTEDAEIVWKPIIEEDKNMRSQRLIQMLQAGATTVNEVREEMGFRRMSEDKYDKLQPPMEPATFGKGVPPKPGAASPKAPELNRITEQNKKPPESHMKLEDLKSKKIQLLQLDEAFRVKMLDLARKTKFDLKDDGKLVKQVKHEAQTEAQDIINEHIVASYLVGRLNANGALGKEDDLTLKQEDLESLANLKDSCINDFDKILEDMVIMKEEGKLE